MVPDMAYVKHLAEVKLASRSTQCADAASLPNRRHLRLSIHPLFVPDLQPSRALLGFKLAQHGMLAARFGCRQGIHLQTVYPGVVVFNGPPEGVNPALFDFITAPAPAHHLQMFSVAGADGRPAVGRSHNQAALASMGVELSRRQGQPTPAALGPDPEATLTEVGASPA